MKYKIDEELRSIRAHRLPTNRLALGTTRCLLGAVNYLHRRGLKGLIHPTVIPSPDGHAIASIVIQPGHATTLLPALIYFHGGAFIMKPAPQHLDNAVRYAHRARCIVVFVEYRLAPQHPFPAGFNDCFAALKWVIANAPRLGADSARIAVGGDSAGGGLAAGIAQRARDEQISLEGQLLLYPAVDLACTRPSTTAFAQVPPFKGLSGEKIARMYLGRALAQGVPRYACPINGELSGLPPAYVETPEFDPLHDQGLQYARAMRASGVTVELNEIMGGLHGFDILAPRASVSIEAIERRIRFLRRILRAVPS